MSVQSVSKTAFSAKNDGSDYQRSNAGKFLGALGGAGIAGLGIYQTEQALKQKGVLEKFLDMFKLNKEQLKKEKNNKYIITALIWAMLGLIVGAVADVFINSFKKNKADTRAG